MAIPGMPAASHALRTEGVREDERHVAVVGLVDVVVAVQHPGGEDAADRPEEVAQPRDARRRQQAPQQASVQRQHDEAAEDPPHVLGDQPAGDEVREVAEHQPAGAEVHGVGGAEEPDAETADDHHDHGDLGDLADAAEGDRRAEQGERDRVGDQVSERHVQERRQGDADETARRPRPDPPLVQRRARYEVDDLHRPHHRQHRGDEDQARSDIRRPRPFDLRRHRRHARHATMLAVGLAASMGRWRIRCPKASRPRSTTPRSALRPSSTPPRPRSSTSSAGRRTTR